jgi:acetyl-CoA carboxylase biotin carboxyl carrier protein
VDLKQIKELMAAMEKAGIDEIDITDKDYKIHLKRKPEASPVVHTPPPVYYPPQERFPHPPLPHKIDHSSHVETHPEKKAENGKFINSPMVGTLYTSPSPEDPPFIKLGDKVDENTIVCIIEAMKVMNEVKAGCVGTVAEIYASNATPVEFGTKLI